MAFTFHTVGSVKVLLHERGGTSNPTSKKHEKTIPKARTPETCSTSRCRPAEMVRRRFLDPKRYLGDGPNSLFHEGGTTIVIHEKTDDYKTDPAGNSGARIALRRHRSMSMDLRRAAVPSSGIHGASTPPAPPESIESGAGCCEVLPARTVNTSVQER